MRIINDDYYQFPVVYISVSCYMHSYNILSCVYLLCLIHLILNVFINECVLNYFRHNSLVSCFLAKTCTYADMPINWTELNINA